MAAVKEEPMVKELVTLELSFPDGNGIVTVGPDHPIVAGLRKCIATGKPAGRLLLLTAKATPQSSTKFIGTVAWTPGERFLFFPGRQSSIGSSHPDTSLNGQDLDHVALEMEPDMSAFAEHNAALPGGVGSRGQKRRGQIAPLMLHSWFSLLRPTLEHYEDLPALLKFEFSMPSSDVARRCRAMLEDPLRTDMCLCAFQPNRLVAPRTTFSWTFGQGGAHSGNNGES